MMTRQQIEIVQATYRHIAESSEAGAVFFEGLVRMGHKIRSIRGDNAEYGAKMIAMVRFAVTGLSKLEGILHNLESEPVAPNPHYERVAGAMRFTLERTLGDAFTAEIQDAWNAAWNVFRTSWSARLCSSAAMPAAA